MVTHTLLRLFIGRRRELTVRSHRDIGSQTDWAVVLDSSFHTCEQLRAKSLVCKLGLSTEIPNTNSVGHERHSAYMASGCSSQIIGIS